MERSVIRDSRSRIALRSMRATNTPKAHDPQAQVGRIPAVFPQEGPAHRQAPQPRHLCEPAGGREARARGAILQAPRRLGRVFVSARTTSRPIRTSGISSEAEWHEAAVLRILTPEATSRAP